MRSRSRRLEAMGEASRDAVLLPASTLVRGLPSLRLAAGEAARFRQGGAVPAPGMEDGSIAAFAAATTCSVSRPLRAAWRSTAPGGRSAARA